MAISAVLVTGLAIILVGTRVTGQVISGRLLEVAEVNGNTQCNQCIDQEGAKFCTHFEDRQSGYCCGEFESSETCLEPYECSGEEGRTEDAAYIMCPDDPDVCGNQSIMVDDQNKESEFLITPRTSNSKCAYHVTTNSDSQSKFKLSSMNITGAQVDIFNEVSENVYTYEASISEGYHSVEFTFTPKDYIHIVVIPADKGTKIRIKGKFDTSRFKKYTDIDEHIKNIFELILTIFFTLVITVICVALFCLYGKYVKRMLLSNDVEYEEPKPASLVNESSVRASDAATDFQYDSNNSFAKDGKQLYKSDEISKEEDGPFPLKRSNDNQKSKFGHNVKLTKKPKLLEEPKVDPNTFNKSADESIADTVDLESRHSDGY